MRNIIFSTREYYHIYNRGVDKHKVFVDHDDYQRFLLSMNLLNDERDGLMTKWRDFKKFNPEAQLLDFQEFNTGRKPLVEFCAYCLNPNHKHFILKQVKDDGIKRFMHKLGTGYSNYFNTKYDRSGTLFQGPFKAIHIDSNEYLLFLSAYVNKNYFIHGYGDEIWQYSSLPDYIGKRKGTLCNKEIILNQFDGSFSKYKKFMGENALYFKNRKELEGYMLEKC